MMKTLALLLVSVLLASSTFATTKEEDTVNLNYRGPQLNYQVPYDKDIAYADKSVPFLFDYLPPVNIKSYHEGKMIRTNK